MAELTEKTLEIMFTVLKKHADELDRGADPFLVVAKDRGLKKIPREFFHNIFIELNKQDKISILWDGDEIIHVFVNAGLNSNRTPKRPRPNCVVLVDIENIRYARHLPPHIFVGDALNEQIKTSGFIVRERFAFVNTKGVQMGVITASQFMSQVTTLAKQGFIPVICAYTDEKHPSPDDDMMKRLARSFFGHPDVETMLVVSADRDFLEMKAEADGMGHDFVVFATSSNANPEYLERVQANIIDLSEADQEKYNFIERYMRAIKESKQVIKATSDNEQLAVIFLDEIMKILPTMRRESPFFHFRGIIWKNIPEDMRKLYSEDLLGKVLQVISTYTDIILTIPDRFRSNNAKFVFRGESKDIKIFLI